MPEYTHYKVLKILEQNPQVSQRELANNFKNSSNKLAYFYVLTPSGIEAKAKISIQFLQRKMEEYEALGIEIERLKREQDELES
jgi:hypothetical protein